MNKQTKNGSQEPVTKRDLENTKGDLEKALENTKRDLEKTLKEQASVILKDVDERLDEQTQVILEAVDERLDKKLAQKIDPVMAGIDKIVKELETHRDEDKAGAKQLRRHEDKLNDHESRIKTLERV